MLQRVIDAVHAAFHIDGVAHATSSARMSPVALMPLISYAISLREQRVAAY